jgi:hypothetical protein
LRHTQQPPGNKAGPKTLLKWHNGTKQEVMTQNNSDLGLFLVTKGWEGPATEGVDASVILLLNSNWWLSCMGWPPEISSLWI